MWRWFLEVILGGNLRRLGGFGDGDNGDVEVGMYKAKSGMLTGLFSSLFAGPLRRHHQERVEVGEVARILPPRLLQEHPRGCPGHQWHEALPGDHFPRERQGAQGGCSHEAVRWRYWPNCARFVQSTTWGCGAGGGKDGWPEHGRAGNCAMGFES